MGHSAAVAPEGQNVYNRRCQPADRTAPNDISPNGAQQSDGIDITLLRGNNGTVSLQSKHPFLANAPFDYPLFRNTDAIALIEM